MQGIKIAISKKDLDENTILERFLWFRNFFCCGSDKRLLIILTIIIWKSVEIVMDKLYKTETIQLDEHSYQRA